uniref:Uncharacterized protein n=1 Tax=Anguilla anguilla TaxID=7936 RepID=A0A0E9VH05_ANGAN
MWSWNTQRTPLFRDVPGHRFEGCSNRNSVFLFNCRSEKVTDPRCRSDSLLLLGFIVRITLFRKGFKCSTKIMHSTYMYAYK